MRNLNPADWSYVEDDGSTWTADPETEPVPSGRWFLAGVLLVIAAVVLYALAKETQ